jgi:hypothetical protein
MITTSNEAYGFFGNIGSSNLVVALKAKLFDMVGNIVKKALSTHNITDEEAAAVLDSKFGRHLSDYLSSESDIAAIKLKVSEALSQSSWKKNAINELQYFRSLQSEGMEESGRIISNLLTESSSTLTTRERRILGNAISKEPVLGGNEKVPKLGQALNVLSRVLSDNGFVLDMVSGDILMGHKGNRALPFRRALPEGSDAFDEGQEIDSRISFNWEDLNASSSAQRQLDPKNYEVIAYLT